MRLTTLLLSLALATAAMAGNASDSLALAIAMNNPDLLSRRHIIDAELATSRQDNTLAGPELEGELKFKHDAGSEKRWGVSLAQSFDWPGVYAARRRAINEQASVSNMLKRQALVEAWYEAKSAIIDFNATAETADELQAAANNARQLLEIYERALSRGETTILEVNKLKLQLIAISAKAASAAAATTTASMRLQALAPDMPIPANIPATEIEAFDIAECNRAAQLPLHIAESAAKQARYEAQAQKRSFLPSFKVALVHDYEDGSHFTGFSVGIGLPAWNNRHSRDAARARVAAADLDIVRAEADAHTAFNQDLLDIAALQGAYSQAEPLFRDSAYTDTLQKALDAGKLSLFDYLREYNEYLDAKVEFISLKTELARNIASLKRYMLQ